MVTVHTWEPAHIEYTLPSAVVVLVEVVLVVDVCVWGGGGDLTDHSPLAFFFSKWRSTRMYEFLGQDQFTVAQQAEKTVSGCSPTSCV